MAQFAYCIEYFNSMTAITAPVNQVDEIKWAVRFDSSCMNTHFFARLTARRQRTNPYSAA